MLKTRNKIVEDIMMITSLEDKAESKNSFGSRNLEFKNEFNPFYNTLKIERKSSRRRGLNLKPSSYDEGPCIRGIEFRVIYASVL